MSPCECAIICDCSCKAKTKNCIFIAHWRNIICSNRGGLAVYNGRRCIIIEDAV